MPKNLTANVAAAAHRKRMGRIVAEGMRQPSVEVVGEVADKLTPGDLQKSVVLLAGKIGHAKAMRAIFAQLTDVEKASPDVPKLIPAVTERDQVVSLAIPKKSFPSTPESRIATVYGKPVNVRQRLIEFKDDGTHGVLWVQPDSPVWTGWVVWAKKNTNTQQQGWMLDGTYSWRGIRLK